MTSALCNLVKEFDIHIYSRKYYVFITSIILFIIIL